VRGPTAETKRSSTMSRVPPPPQVRTAQEGSTRGEAAGAHPAGVLGGVQQLTAHHPAHMPHMPTSPPSALPACLSDPACCRCSSPLLRLQPMAMWCAMHWVARPSTSCWGPLKMFGASRRCARRAGEGRGKGRAGQGGWRIEPAGLCTLIGLPWRWYPALSWRHSHCPPHFNLQQPAPFPHPPTHPPPAGAHPVQPDGAAAVPAGGVHGQPGVQGRGARVQQGRCWRHFLRGGGGHVQVGGRVHGWAKSMKTARGSMAEKELEA
jgi:hypothetical protein